MRLSLRLPALRGRLPAPSAAMALALVACLLSGLALFGPAGRAAPPPSLPPPGSTEARLALVGVELLLPHLAGAAAYPRPYAIATLLAAEDAELSAALRPLATAAALGAPEPPALAAGFAALAEAALRAEAGLAPDGALAGLAVRALRLGAALGTADSPALAATRLAEAALARGDIAGAEAVVGTLRGEAAAVLAPWRAAAARRSVAEASAVRLARLLRYRDGFP